MPSQGGKESSNCLKRGKRRVTEMRLLASDWLRGWRAFCGLPHGEVKQNQRFSRLLSTIKGKFLKITTCLYMLSTSPPQKFTETSVITPLVFFLCLIRIQFNSEEQWTKALKFVLTNLKWGLAWVSSQFTEKWLRLAVSLDNALLQEVYNVRTQNQLTLNNYSCSLKFAFEESNRNKTL